MSTFTVWAAGRINLIGEHTDYTGGLALPMAIDRGTRIHGSGGGDVVHLVSEHDPLPAVVPLDVEDPSRIEPPWARYVAGVVSELQPRTGARGTVSSDLPIGAGVSSSASLSLAVALALGFDGDSLELAKLCQRAEQRASGVPCGLMDQLAIASGAAGSAVLIDCSTETVTPVAVPAGLRVVGLHSGEQRALAGSAYARRREECAAAEQVVGPLRDAAIEDLAAIADPVVRRRARHVVTENARVLAFVEALEKGDFCGAGALLDASHQSLRDDFEVSIPAVEEAVGRLRATPGVYGARLTGAGFGGMVIGLCDAEAALPDSLALSVFQASRGLRVA